MRTMTRPVFPMTLGALLCLATSAYAQDVTATVARAQRTLTDIDRLIDGIQARNAAGGVQAAETGGWKNLFDGKSLAGWKRTEFGGGGDVRVESPFQGGAPAIVVKFGSALSGLTWTGDVPKSNYEIALDAMKLDGSDFSCGLTFPVGNSYASLILGGWGGGVVGISNIDNLNASENETTKYMAFPANRWYHVRMRVTPTKLEAWLNEKQVINQNIIGKKISLRIGEITKSVPLGIATYQTSAAYRNIKIRQLDMK